MTECGMIGAKQHGMSISATADLLGFACRTVSSVYREWPKKDKPCSECQFSVWKCPIDGKGQKQWPDWFKLLERQQLKYPLVTTKACRRASLNEVPVKP